MLVHLSQKNDFCYYNLSITIFLNIWVRLQIMEGSHMLEDIYFALVAFVLILCLAIFKGVKDYKIRARKIYLEELKIQEELAHSNLNKH
jgi:hypothetical protein